MTGQGTRVWERRAFDTPLRGMGRTLDEVRRYDDGRGAWMS
jgi:hypothetical protein